ncbi:GPI mannosyltransferase 3 [Parasteatoda tepidariorum]|uniref:GPI mannosyltransferase 3 n=1 Tax=Parasteatoda tepidariorum TaxID=114398 RepID=UPI00077F888B|nr:GPI mannosyltransferase 3 [Parasteatoda tepidariorum]
MKKFNNNNLMFIMILAIRLLSVYIVQTFFVPDEFWQSLEVSHKLTFGYGYWTWEWQKKIRSSVYPILISIFYSILPDFKTVIIHFPRILQALLSALGDYYTFKLASKLFGCHCGQWTVFNICSSWFLFYCSPRTLTNMAETSFTAIGLYLYPWKMKPNKKTSCKYLWFTGASILMRPTAIVMWIALYAYHVWREKYIYHLFKNTFISGTILFSFLIICDRWCYNQWTVTLYNFFLFNWSKDIGIFYGSHHFLWLLVVGLPVVLTTLIIPFVLGLTIRKLRPFYILVLWFILIFSIPSHKEFRFLLPVMPVCMIITGVVMTEIANEKVQLYRLKISKNLSSYLAFSSILCNAPLSIYMSVFHQRGTMDLMHHISHIATDDSKILFLMPCHSTPYYSHVHKNISMKFLTCEPNFEDSVNYKDEADEFFQDPSKWLTSFYELDSKKIYPSHIAMFDSLYDQVSIFLERHRYYLCFRTFHSHITENKRGKYVLLYCKS